jgi:hypothetical protein
MIQPEKDIIVEYFNYQPPAAMRYRFGGAGWLKLQAAYRFTDHLSAHIEFGFTSLDLDAIAEDERLRSSTEQYGDRMHLSGSSMRIGMGYHL